ncbi:cobalamin biosynthesis protein [Candidatus Bathyarchaeota archaeon]|nr:cobalamin biosynthesis protein [Candidatus Bathyarchaeota archaeon]
MFSPKLVELATLVAVLTLALLIDLALGEPPKKIHLTVWIGTLIEFLKPKLRNKSSNIEKLNGILLALTVVGFFAISSYFTLLILRQYIGRIAYVVVAAFFLKQTFAIRSMEHHAVPIATALEDGDIKTARGLLQHLVRRGTWNLNEQQVISGAVESIAEGTVDGVTSAIFYFALAGIPGAIAFRAINTLDSIVGYKDPEHAYLGWFSARLDTIANFIPARLTALLMVLAAWLSGESWRNARRILSRDKGKTDSLNAGWPMSTMAGALNVQLEKLNCYTLGDANEELTARHIARALRIMKLTIILFIAFIVIPILFAITLV